MKETSLTRRILSTSTLILYLMLMGLITLGVNAAGIPVFNTRLD